MKRFQHVLEASGVKKSLIKLGVKEGDRVIVGEVILHNLIFALTIPLVIDMQIEHEQPNIKVKARCRETVFKYI